MSRLFVPGRWKGCMCDLRLFPAFTICCWATAHLWLKTTNSLISPKRRYCEKQNKSLTEAQEDKKTRQFWGKCIKKKKSIQLLLGCVDYILVMQNSMTKDNVWLLEVSINVRAYKWIVEQFSKEAQTPSPCVLSTAISENSLRCRNVKCQGMKCDIPRKEAVERALTFNSQSRSQGDLLGILWMNITNKVSQWS